MRKPIKPFAVETRRTGRTPLARPARIAQPGDDEAVKAPSQPEWPPLPADDDSYVAAMRAADALFSRPAPEPTLEREAEAVFAPAVPAEPARRILPSLNEDDHISRLLAEEEDERPRRGRKPREPGDPRPIRAPSEEEPAMTHEPTAELALAGAGIEPNGAIPGYVRGQIYGRYARHDRTRPGEHWRKRTLKPLW